jgi:hypothetical protein
MIDFTAPLEGMNRAVQMLDKAAERIAVAPFTASSDAPHDTVDLSAEAVALLEARADFSANAKLVRTADEMSKTLIAMLG